MYRIRLTTGEEAVFRTVDELALAIGSGVVSPKSEVFHKAANRWLPVESHPDYKAVVTGKRPALPPERSVSTSANRPAITAQTLSAADGRASVAGPEMSAAPVVPGRRTPMSPPPAAAPRPVATAAPPAPGPTSPAATPPRTQAVRIPRSQPKGRGPLVLAVATGAFCLISAGAYLVAPEVRGWAAGVLPRSGPVEGMPPVPAVPGVVSPPVVDDWPPSTSEAILDSAPTVPPPPGAPAQLEITPEAALPTRVSRLRSGRTTGVSYQEAYAEARAEMDESLGYVRFRRVFAQSRFSSPDSIRAARRMVAAAGNILRVYRGQEVMLEQTYRPDDPGGRGTLREPFETTETARALLADVDSLFGLLVAQQGRFLFDGTSLQFTDPRSARLYSDLRRRILLTLSDWRRAPDLDPGVTVPRLSLALGADTPPPAR